MGQGEGTGRVDGECPEAEVAFPNLRKEGYRRTSEKDPDCNCIAYAAGRADQKWWPTDDEGYYWPLSDPHDDSIAAFISAFGTEGYSPCDNADVEQGYEKVAIYVDRNGKPKHAARQLPESGEWLSKLGLAEDIAHKTLRAIEDGEGATPLYGEAKQFLKRPVGKHLAPEAQAPEVQAPLEESEPAQGNTPQGNA
jgi:hypothetical protein